MWHLYETANASFLPLKTPLFTWVTSLSSIPFPSRIRIQLRQVWNLPQLCMCVLIKYVKSILAKSWGGWRWAKTGWSTSFILLTPVHQDCAVMVFFFQQAMLSLPFLNLSARCEKNSNLIETYIWGILFERYSTKKMSIKCKLILSVLLPWECHQDFTHIIYKHLGCGLKSCNTNLWRHIIKNMHFFL